MLRQLPQVSQPLLHVPIALLVHGSSLGSSPKGQMCDTHQFVRCTGPSNTTGQSLTDSVCWCRPLCGHGWAVSAAPSAAAGACSPGPEHLVWRPSSAPASAAAGGPARRSHAASTACAWGIPDAHAGHGCHGAVWCSAAAASARNQGNGAQGKCCGGAGCCQEGSLCGSAGLMSPTVPIDVDAPSQVSQPNHGYFR